MLSLDGHFPLGRSFDQAPPFNGNRNYEVFSGKTREKRAFEDRHASAGRRRQVGAMVSTVPDSAVHVRPSPLAGLSM